MQSVIFSTSVHNSILETDLIVVAMNVTLFSVYYKREYPCFTMSTIVCAYCGCNCSTAILKGKTITENTRLVITYRPFTYAISESKLRVLKTFA